MCAVLCTLTVTRLVRCCPFEPSPSCDHAGVCPGTGVGFLVALPVTNAYGIHVVLYGEAAFSIAILLLCVVDHALFPPLPPSYPSATASLHRTVDTIKDFRMLVGNGNLMVLALAYGVSLGTYSGWSGVRCL